MADITASIVLYETPKPVLSQLLTSIQQSSTSLHLYLIDNSINPEPPSFTAPWITYIKADRNCGYGTGHNIALRKAIEESQFHFVLNPDIYFGPDELEKMLRYMQANKDVGQLMPLVTYPNGHIQHLCKLLPRPLDLIFRRFLPDPLRRITKKSLETFELRFTGYNQEMDVPFLSGCFMLLRTSALRTVGLFDERFFMYAEDIDLSRRMHSHFRTVFFPEATIIHDHQRASYVTAHALFTHIANAAKYFNKWGWFFDSERSRVNRQTLRQLQKK